MPRPRHPRTDWKPGDRLTHRFNPELGPGLVTELDGRTVVVRFPASDATLRLSMDSDAIRPLVLRAGTRALLLPAGEAVIIDSIGEEGTAVLSDGREAEIDKLWPMDVGHSLIERLAQGEIDSLEEFSVRLDALHLSAIREADGLGSFLGGRIRIFPHQIYVAEQATRADPVRWLLADEVGLGKTVESCLILNHLIRTGRADRTLVVAPSTLTVQWLGELWRKYHQVFVLLDEKRLGDVERDYGKGFNPFDAHARAVISLELLRDRPRLAEQAAESGIDLLIVDEAHHLKRPPGHPGNPEYRVVHTISSSSEHVLLLSATPLEDDAHGFFRLLQMLRPDEFPEELDVNERLESSTPLPPCTSATRREDIGGLPPREAVPVNIKEKDWQDHAAVEAALAEFPAPHAVARRKKVRLIRRGLASGAALEAALDPGDTDSRALARRAAASDPRVNWLAEQARGWLDDGDKTLVFVAHRESLEMLKTALSRKVQLRVGLFHEDLSPGQRDIEVAQFRLPVGPSMLISTECGGEGRNFEFCTRLVLFDLPWNPMIVEQRIGRLDRIGRDMPVRIVYFRPPQGTGAAVAGLYENLGLFREPLGGVERELATVESAIEELALAPPGTLDDGHFRSITYEAVSARDRVREAAYRELHRAPFRSELAEGILSRIPEELEELTQDVSLATCDRLDIHVEEHRRGRRQSIELGKRARVESLPGVAAGASFLGTFDREEALRDEGIDFYASGHPLIEGLMAHLEDNPLGRVALLHLSGEEGVDDGFGLLALYKSGPQFEAVAIDAEGKDRPEWAELLTRRPLRSKRVKKSTWIGQPGWPALIRALGLHLETRGRPVAVAAFRIGD